MNKIIKLTLFLAVVAGLSGAALSFVYQMTDPIIQEAAIASEKENLVKIYNSGEEFKALDTGLADYTALQGCYEASSGGTVKGYVYKCSVTGYGGASTPIVYLIALDKDGTYKGYEVIDCSGETSGFGSKVAEEGFKSGIVGKSIDESIDVISGATISSSAVVDGINQATEHYNANFK
ncbi:MAG: FMN-binding protein [Coprobacillus sp.]|nr:FMN-binding protein [Coprobacillus sp.]